MLFLSLLQLLPALALALPAYHQEDPLELTVGIIVWSRVGAFVLIYGLFFSDTTPLRDVGMLQHGETSTNDSSNSTVETKNS